MKTKYDWWAAFAYVADRTFLGFICSCALLFCLIGLVISAVGFLFAVFGPVAGVLGLMVTSAIGLYILTYKEIKRRKFFYEKH